MFTSKATNNVFTQKDVTVMFSVLQGSTEAEKLCHLSAGHFPGKTAA